MSFKMVPVPADLVFDVMRFVLAREDEDAARRHRERLGQLLTEDDFTHSLLVLVATDASGGRLSRVREVAAELGTDDPTVVAAVRRLNTDAVAAGFERVLRLKKETFQTADGSTWNSLVVTMTPEVAAIVGGLIADATDAPP
jgi:hypothetical protein